MPRSPSTSTRGILNPAASAAHFQLTRHLPSAELAPFVERYWIVRWDLRGRDPYVAETLPHPCVNCVIEAPGARVWGVWTQRFERVLEGKGLVFGIKLRPGGFHPFFGGREVTALTDRTVPMRAVFGDEVDALAEKVLASDDDAEQVALVERLLLARSPAPDPNVDTVIRVVQTTLMDPSIQRVEQLAARVDLPLRTLQRLFRRYVGVSPGWVIRRHRLHEAAERAAAGKHVNWAELAVELGYFDQAHLNRDFRAQLGRTPAQYAATCAGSATGAARSP